MSIDVKQDGFKEFPLKINKHSLTNTKDLIKYLKLASNNKINFNKPCGQCLPAPVCGVLFFKELAMKKEIYSIDANDNSITKKCKPIKYYIDENGCWICISHCFASPLPYPLLRRNKKNICMSRYIYEKFKGRIPEKHMMRHTCDNPKCINPEHLLTGTSKDNCNDKVKRGRTQNQNGEKNPYSKLTRKQILEIRNSKESLTTLGKKYGVTFQNISKIKNRISWKHLGDE